MKKIFLSLALIVTLALSATSIGKGDTKQEARSDARNLGNATCILGRGYGKTLDTTYRQKSDGTWICILKHTCGRSR
jgi:hypothetical protein